MLAQSLLAPPALLADSCGTFCCAASNARYASLLPTHVSAAMFGMLLAACASGGAPAAPDLDRNLNRIEHVVVIYGENRSFDNLYGLFPGANGIADARPENTLQRDLDGTLLPRLPTVWKGASNSADTAYPSDLRNAPFRIDAAPVNLPLATPTRDLVHRFYQNQEQINGGRNDKFAALSDAGGLTMGYYDGSALPLWRIAREFTLADNFFMGAFGGSFLNHFWLVCACTPVFTDAPASVRAQLDSNGKLVRRAQSPVSALDGPVQLADGALTPDGYAVNTMQPPYQPSQVPPAAGGDARLADPARNPLPPQTLTTIGDTLTARGVSWVWYAGAWNAALADGMQDAGTKRTIIYASADHAPNFQPHHQPFNYFVNYAPGTAQRARHLKDGADLLVDIDHGTLPQVAFYKPQGTLNQHPGYTDALSGDAHIADVIARIRASALWNSTLILVTYDENGGFWDHVAPPAGDRWGPGTRVPALLVSPFVKKGFVDHTSYDTTSILKFITRRFALQPLPGVRPNAGDLTSALAFPAR